MWFKKCVQALSRSLEQFKKSFCTHKNLSDWQLAIQKKYSLSEFMAEKAVCLDCGKEAYRIARRKNEEQEFHPARIVNGKMVFGPDN